MRIQPSVPYSQEAFDDLVLGQLEAYLASVGIFVAGYDVSVVTSGRPEDPLLAAYFPKEFYRVVQMDEAETTVLQGGLRRYPRLTVEPLDREIWDRALSGLIRPELSGQGNVAVVEALATSFGAGYRSLFELLHGALRARGDFWGFVERHSQTVAGYDRAERASVAVNYALYSLLTAGPHDAERLGEAFSRSIVAHGAQHVADGERAATDPVFEAHKRRTFSDDPSAQELTERRAYANQLFETPRITLIHLLSDYDETAAEGARTESAHETAKNNLLETVVAEIQRRPERYGVELRPEHPMGLDLQVIGQLYLLNEDPARIERLREALLPSLALARPGWRWWHYLLGGGALGLGGLAARHLLRSRPTDAESSEGSPVAGQEEGGVDLDLDDYPNPRHFVPLEGRITIPLSTLAKWGNGFRVYMGEPGNERFLWFHTPSLEHAWEYEIRPLTNQFIAGLHILPSEGEVALEPEAGVDWIAVEQMPETDVALAEELLGWIQWDDPFNPKPRRRMHRVVSSLGILDLGENADLRERILRQMGSLLLIAANAPTDERDPIVITQWNDSGVAVRIGALRSIMHLVMDPASLGIAQPILEVFEERLNGDIRQSLEGGGNKQVFERLGKIFETVQLRLDGVGEQLQAGQIPQAIRAETERRFGIRTEAPPPDEESSNPAVRALAVAFREGRGLSQRFISPEGGFKVIGVSSLAGAADRLHGVVHVELEEAKLHQDAANTEELLASLDFGHMQVLFPDPEDLGLYIGRGPLHDNPMDYLPVSARLVGVFQPGAWDESIVQMLAGELPEDEKWALPLHAAYGGKRLPVALRKTAQGELAIVSDWLKVDPERDAPDQQSTDDSVDVFVAFAASLFSGLEEEGMRSLLVVEDDPAIRARIVKIIRQWPVSLRVHEASMTFQAQDILLKYGDRFDAVLTDLSLGDGGRGVELFAVAKKGDGTPIPTAIFSDAVVELHMDSAYAGAIQDRSHPLVAVAQKPGDLDAYEEPVLALLRTLDNAVRAAGLEENRLLTRLAQAAEGQSGIWVVTPDAIQDPAGLEEMVKRLPAALLQRIIWFDTGVALAERLRVLEPTLQIIEGNDTQALILALLSHQKADRIATTSQALALYLQEILPMTVTYLKTTTVKLILAALGVPIELLDRIDPTDLETLFAPLIAA